MILYCVFFFYCSAVPEQVLVYDHQQKQHSAGGINLLHLFGQLRFSYFPRFIFLYGPANTDDMTHF